MHPLVDPVHALLVGLLVTWHAGALVEVLRSRRSSTAKLRWVLLIVLLPVIGVLDYYLAGRDPKRRRGPGVVGYLTVAGLWVLLLLLIIRWQWPGHELLGWFGGWSLITFALYAYDKRAAGAGNDARGHSKAARVDELALHLVALLGGVFGGWLGRHALRHKTKKRSFAIVLALATVLHAAVIASKLLGLW